MGDADYRANNNLYGFDFTEIEMARRRRKSQALITPTDVAPAVAPQVSLSDALALLVYLGRRWDEVAREAALKAGALEANHHWRRIQIK